MPDNMTTTATTPPAISEYYDRALLETARAYLVHDQFAQVRPLPQKNSETIKFSRPNTFAPNTTKLVEGVTPQGQSFSYTRLTATVEQYGTFCTFSDKVDFTSQDAVLTDIARELGHQAGESIDELRRDVLVAGSNAILANGASRAAINTIFDQADIESAINFFRNQNAQMIMEIIEATNKVSTQGIRPAYFAIVHPNLIKTLEGFADWVPVVKYADQRPVMRNEIGSVKEVRFVWSTKGKIWAGAGASGGSSVRETNSKADVYAIPIIARNAYGIVPMTGKSLENIRKAIGSSGTGDPLDQRGTSGWKAHTTTVILNDAFITRIETAAAL